MGLGSHATVQSINFQVLGLRCGACVKKLETSLSKCSGVTASEVDVLSGACRVFGKEISKLSVRKSVEAVGFNLLVDEESMSKLLIEVKGSEWKKILKNMRGVTKFTGRIQRIRSFRVFEYQLEISYDSVLIGAREILEKVKGRVLTGSIDGPEFDRLLIFEFLAVWGCIFYGGLEGAIMTQIFPAGRIHKRSISEIILAIKTGSFFGLGMDVLLSIGIIASFIASILDSHSYDASSVLTLMVLFGRLIESFSRIYICQVLSVEAVDEFELCGSEDVGNDFYDTTSLPLQLIQIEDKVKVRQGGVLPADGLLVFPEVVWIEEALETGELIPRRKFHGDRVLAGSFFIRSDKLGFSEQEQFMIFHVEQISPNTVLSRIEKLTLKFRKPGTQKIADSLAGWFVPFIVGISLMACSVWVALGMNWLSSVNRAISVLVISCPCALGLASPLARGVGVAVAKRRGLAVKEAGMLEISSQMDILIFDKTATLTEGKGRVVEFLMRDSDFCEKSLWASIVALENNFAHPVGHAVREFAISRLPENDALPIVTDFEYLPAVGVRGQVGGRDLVISGESLKSTGGSGVRIQIDGKVIAELVIQDPIKKGVNHMIKELTNFGIEIWICSGDNQQVVESIGKEIGVQISRCRGGVTPQGKTELIESLRRVSSKEPGFTKYARNFSNFFQYTPVMDVEMGVEISSVIGMVGDGANDGPAIGAADVGIAVGVCGLATKTADVVLLDKLEGLVDLIKISRSVLMTIRLNLLWAIGFNCFAIPMAVFTNIPPEIASLLMTCSSLLVLLNSFFLYLSYVR